MQAIQTNNLDFATELREDIDAKQIRLPSLPDVALRVKKAVEGESSAREIAHLIAQDIALAGRIVQIANSPLYRGAAEVDSIQLAVTRLGTRLVKSLVIGLAMRQMFNSSSKLLSQFFREIWEDGLQVAAICRILADQVPEADPEEAMLAGLLHNIGTLPILARLDEADANHIGAKEVQQLLDELGPITGTQILRSWQLPEALIAVPEGCHALQRDPGPLADDVDIVLASRLQYLVSEGFLDVTPELSELPALKKLGIHFEIVVMEQESDAIWSTQLRNAFDC